MEGVKEIRPTKNFTLQFLNSFLCRTKCEKTHRYCENEDDMIGSEIQKRLYNSGKCLFTYLHSCLGKTH